MQQSVQVAIGANQIRQIDGLYSLNDLHRASGGAAKHQPALFMRLEQTQALVAEIENSTDSQSLKITTGRNGGTYACKELVIAYAAWISAAFHLRVIRVFLDAVQPALPNACITPEQAGELSTLIAERFPDGFFCCAADKGCGTLAAPTNQCRQIRPVSAVFAFLQPLFTGGASGSRKAPAVSLSRRSAPPTLAHGWLLKVNGGHHG